jgi:hypothetical protein
LFNLEIAPLITYLRGKFRHFGDPYQINIEEETKVVQASVDDLVIFSESK